MKNRKGFTMVELLVSIVIVGILATLILGGVGKMQAAAASANCMQNLRRLYMGILSYTQDNRGFIPPPHGKDLSGIYEGYNMNQYWWGQAYLAPYLTKERSRSSAGKLTQEEAKVFNCPARNVAYDSFWLQHSDPAVSYVMATPNSPEEYQMLNIKNRSGKLLLTEGRHSNLAKGVAWTNPDDSKANSSQRLRRFHGNGMNLLFYDGHIEVFAGKDEELQEYLK